jgi:hypothetical protein
MTLQDAKLLGDAINKIEQGTDEPGDVVSFRGDGRSVVIYVLQDAYAFSFYDSRAAANREAKSPSLNI